MGFAPTIVVNGPIDNQPRRDFARRIARGLVIEDTRLIGHNLSKEMCWSYGASTGYCRLAPIYGVFLVVTDSDARETAFGFFRYPEVIQDISGGVLMAVPGDGDWISGNFVNSPDSRYRAIVRRFRDGGYLASEHDEFAPHNAANNSYT